MFEFESAEYIKALYRAFIDYDKAFDCVDIAAVMKALRNQGVDEAYIRLLEDIYKDSTGTIILHKQIEKFPFRKDVKQEDTISPKLFTAYFESVFRKLDWWHFGVRFNWVYLGQLRLAHNIVFLNNSVEDLQGIIHDLHRERLVVGFRIIMKKSKVMSNSLAVKQPFTNRNAILEEVDVYSYLGQLVSPDTSHEKELLRIISMGMGAFGMHSQKITSSLPLSLKLKKM